MTATEKFLFDFDFDRPAVNDVDIDELSEEKAEDLVPEIIIPTFSEEELNAAREDGFARGKEEGVKETLESIVQQTATALETIIAKIDDIFSLQEDANTTTARDAVNVSTSITRKLFPQFSTLGALDEVERIIRSIMEKMIDEPRLTIMVNDTLLERISSRLDPMMAETGFEGKVIFNGDESLPLSDCRIEWGTGTASRDTTSLWQEIDSLIAKNMSDEDFPTEIATEDKTAQDANDQEAKLEPQPATDENTTKNRVQSEADSSEPADSIVSSPESAPESSVDTVDTVESVESVDSDAPDEEDKE